MAIICASIPSFRPLISHYFPHLLSTAGIGSYNKSDSNPNALGNPGISRNTKRQTQNAFPLVEIGIGARSNGTQGLHGNDSEERIMDHMGVPKAGEISYEANERKSGSFDTSKSEAPK